MPLKNDSATSLTWLAAIILLVGLLIDSPAGRFFSTLVAGGIALIPLCFGNSRRRIFAGVVGLAAVLLACAVFGEYQKDFAKYRERVSRESVAPAAEQSSRQ